MPIPILNGPIPLSRLWNKQAFSVFKNQMIYKNRLNHKFCRICD